jgi:homoserine O-acetyltransferase
VRRGCDVRRAEISSPWGHDSFLMHVPAYHALVADFLR